MTHPSNEDLLGLVRGELPPAAAREVEAHTADCASCRQELAWLRTERGLFRAERTAVPGHTWQGIERRIIVAREARQGRQRRIAVGSGVAAGLAAAAGLLIFAHGPGARVLAPAPPGSVAETPDRAGPADEEDDARPAASHVLDSAETEYLGAIARLADAYEQQRAELDPEVVLRVDEELRQLRDVVAHARGLAGEDPWARRRVLRAYSAYLRSVQAAVLEVRK